MTTPDIGDTGSLFGPYPASPQERESAVAAVFGDAGPLKRVTMRAGRQQCPGCRSMTGDQCGQPGPGGRRRRRRLPHPSRVAVSYPCTSHQLVAGQPCPESSDYSMSGICPVREQLAMEDLRLLALAQRLLADQRADQDREQATRAAELHSA